MASESAGQIEDQFLHRLFPGGCHSIPQAALGGEVEVYRLACARYDDGLCPCFMNGERCQMAFGPPSGIAFSAFLTPDSFHGASGLLGVRFEAFNFDSAGASQTSL
jgi:hypothetical protein